MSLNTTTDITPYFTTSLNTTTNITPYFGPIIITLAFAVGLVLLLVFWGKKNEKNNALQNKPNNDGNKSGENVSNGSGVRVDCDEFVKAYFKSETTSGCFGGKTKYTDWDYDQFILDNINGFFSTKKAAQTIGIDESQIDEKSSISLKGFEYEDGYLSRYGLDGIMRTSQYSVSKIYFSENQIFVYKVFFDFLTHSTDISTREYFYKDITTFSCTNSIKERKEYIEKTRLSGRGCDVMWKKSETLRFCIVVPGDTFSCSVSGVSEFEKTIQGMRQKLREKKTAI